MVAPRNRHRSSGQRVLPTPFTLPAPASSPPPPGSTTDFAPPILAPITSDWFPAHRLSASELIGHRCGAHQMLTLVAYDIADPKRLHHVAKVCEDWGLRIQYSVFECRLEADSFTRFWEELNTVIHPKLDRIVAYKICTKCAREIHSAGVQEHYEKVVAYVC